MNQLLNYLHQRHAPGTVDRYFRSIEIYLETTGEEKAELARYKDVWEYLGLLRDKGYSPANISTELAAIKAYYKFLLHTGKRTDNPTRHIYLNDAKRENRQIQHQDLFTPAELELLLDKENRYELLKYKTKLAVSLYIYQGLTTGEIESLRLYDLNMEEGSIFIRATSKSNSRILHLKNNQILFADRYLNKERPELIKVKSDKLFITKLGTEEKGESLHYLIESQRGLFPERKLNPKTIRQSVIVNWFRQGHGIKDVQIMSGHKYPSTTEAYKPNDIEELKNAVGKFHPLG